MMKTIIILKSTLATVFIGARTLTNLLLEVAYYHVLIVHFILLRDTPYRMEHCLMQPINFISVASSHLNGIAFALQCLLSPLMQRTFDGLFNARCGSAIFCGHNVDILPVVIPIFGVVNLDFFRGVYPSFCLHPQLNIIHILFLDYIVALYPFFITYVLLTFHQIGMEAFQVSSRMSPKTVEHTNIPHRSICHFHPAFQH